MTPPAADDHNIRLTRVYDAPVALVWDAFTLDAHASHWWGPRGFTITTHHKDVRVGGTWSYIMHGPDGTDWPNFTRYLEVQPHERLVYDHGASSADAAPMFRMTVEFRDLGGRTALSLCLTFPDAERARQTRHFIKAAGGNGTWDRLAEYLAQQVEGAPVFVINRSVAAPIETVWSMFTDATLLAQWLPPTGFTMTVHRASIVVGGTCEFTMQQTDVALHGRFGYDELEPPHSLAYHQVFTDVHGTVVRFPGMTDWPEVLATRVTLTDEGHGHTRITVRTAPAEQATAADVAAFVAERTGMAQGWTGSFDAMEAQLGVGE
jgi:uncharacterized protein YndB with AHSA1/START domain